MKNLNNILFIGFVTAVILSPFVTAMEQNQRNSETTALIECHFCTHQNSAGANLCEVCETLLSDQSGRDNFASGKHTRPDSEDLGESRAGKRCCVEIKPESEKSDQQLRLALKLQNDGLFIAKGPQVDSPYFVLERVDANNYPIWQKYGELQHETYSKLSGPLSFLSITEDELAQNEKSHPGYREMVTELLDQHAETIQKYGKYKDIVRYAADPIEKFRKCLKFHDRAEVWVAYAIGLEPSGKFNISMVPEVEMAFAVLTSKDVAFELHMGIVRGMKHLYAEKKMTPKLAIQLHAFAAKAMRKIYPSKRYFITTPLEKMGELIQKALPKTAYQIGHNSPSSQIHIVGETPYDNKFHFQLKSKQGLVEFECDATEAGKKYWWFFSNIQPSSSHPYYVIDLEQLAASF